MNEKEIKQAILHDITEKLEKIDLNNVQSLLDYSLAITVPILFKNCNAIKGSNNFNFAGSFYFTNCSKQQPVSHHQKQGN